MRTDVNRLQTIDRASSWHLFKAIGIRNLRVAGGTADGPEFKIPGPADIDQLFGFAKAANLKVIYTLRLLSGDVQQDAELPK
jgi:hypothetical protein